VHRGKGAVRDDGFIEQAIDGAAAFGDVSRR